MHENHIFFEIFIINLFYFIIFYFYFYFFVFFRRILQLSDLSRKMETIEEQVLPFATDIPTDTLEIIQQNNNKEKTNVNNNSNNNTLNNNNPIKSLLIKPINIENNSIHVTNGQTNLNTQIITQQLAYQSIIINNNNIIVPASERLSNFHKKLNKVLLDNIAINKEKNRLILENKQLEDLISQYLAGTTLSEDILLNDNPLFVVNGRANLNHIPPVRKTTGLNGKDQSIIIQDAIIITNTNTRHLQMSHK